MENTNQAGTYAFGDFDENSKELKRLSRQASIALDLERKLWKDCGLKDGMKAIDLACGPGITSSAMAQMIPNGEVLGIDISEALIQVANANNQKNPLANLSFQTGNVYELTLEENSADFIYSRFLFQHLEHPIKALKNVLKVLKPGGIYCVADVDDGWLMVHPELEEFTSFTKAAAQNQRKNGGDRFVGRKFSSYFNEAGFKHVKQLVVPITSSDIGMKNFLDITTGFKLEQIADDKKDENKKALEKVYGLVEQPNAWGAVGVFVGIGVKE